MLYILTILNFYFLFTALLQYRFPGKSHAVWFGMLCLLSLFLFFAWEFAGIHHMVTMHLYSKVSNSLSLAVLASLLSIIIVSVIESPKKNQVGIGWKLIPIGILLGIQLEMPYIQWAQIALVLLAFYCLFFYKKRFRLSYRNYFYFWLFFIAGQVALKFSDSKDWYYLSWIFASLFLHKLVTQFMVKSKITQKLSETA
jgi:hypothetical protein